MRQLHQIVIAENSYKSKYSIYTVNAVKLIEIENQQYNKEHLITSESSLFSTNFLVISLYSVLNGMVLRTVHV